MNPYDEAHLFDGPEEGSPEWVEEELSWLEAILTWNCFPYQIFSLSKKDGA